MLSISEGVAFSFTPRKVMSSNSFVGQIKAKEATPIQEAAPEKEVVETAELEEAPEMETAELEEGEGQEEGEEQEEGADISEELKEKLMGKDSMMKRLKREEAKKLKEAEELALSEQEESEEEESEEEIAPEGKNKEELEVNGQKFESMEALNTHVSTLTEETETLKKSVEEYRDNESKILEIVENHPEFTQLLGSLSKGDTMRVALIKAGFSPEDFNIESEDEVDAESLVEAKANRKRAISDQKKLQKQFEENSSKAEQTLETFRTKHGLDEKASETLIGNMAKYIQDAMNGIVNEGMLDLFLKGMNYEPETQRLSKESEEKSKRAKEQGEIEGRNAKISIERKKKSGDGIPSLGGGGNLSGNPQSNNLSRYVNPRPSSFKDLMKSKPTKF
jgi:hypothetical protein